LPSKPQTQPTGKDPSFDNEAVDQFVKRVFANWISPELERRRQSGPATPAITEVKKALVRLDRNGAPHVQINDEVGFKAQMIAARAVTAGQALTLRDLGDITWVDPPRVDGKPSAYVLLFIGRMVRIAFNFRPNWPDFRDEEWELESKRLAEFFSLQIVEEVIGPLENAHELLSPYKWWVVQSGIPDPIVAALEAAKARKSKEMMDDLFVSAFDPPRLQKMLEEWSALPEFQARSTIFKEALEAFSGGKYALPVPVLLPHLEGILSDWLLGRGGRLPVGMTSKIAAYQQAASGMTSGYITDQSLKSLLGALKTLGVYKGFKWTNEDGITLSRHKTSHGKVVDYGTQANTLRVFLLLDSLYRQMRYRR